MTLTMPKFKVEYKSTNLADHLSELGATKMFRPDECDFGNMLPKVRLSLLAADRGNFIGSNSEFGLDVSLRDIPRTLRKDMRTARRLSKIRDQISTLIFSGYRPLRGESSS